MTVLAQLTRAVQERNNAQEQIEIFVRDARNNGYSWRQIGNVLGVTKQGAMERYGHLVWQSDMEEENEGSKD